MTDTWEVWVNDAIRGEEALVRLQEANQFNEAPSEGMEYILVNVGLRNVEPNSGSDFASEISMFNSTGSQNTVYDIPSIVEPEPDMSWNVYAGGEVSGWMTVVVAQGETNVSLVFAPGFLEDDTRYLALE